MQKYLLLSITPDETLLHLLQKKIKIYTSSVDSQSFMARYGLTDMASGGAIIQSGLTHFSLYAGHSIEEMSLTVYKRFVLDNQMHSEGNYVSQTCVFCQNDNKH